MASSRSRTKSISRFMLRLSQTETSCTEHTLPVLPLDCAPVRFPKSLTAALPSERGFAISEAIFQAIIC